MKRIILALKAFWQVLSGKNTNVDEPSQQVKVEAPTGKKDIIQDNQFEKGSIFTLVLLQREGRFIDFIQERIDDFSDEQIGTAVRKIHADCKKNT